MKKDSHFKNYLFFMLCSALVIGTAIFYFHISDEKKNTTTIIIDRNTKETTEPVTITKPIRTTTSKTTKIKTTSVPNKAQTIITTENITEFLLLDINVANVDELMKLHGIGEKLSEDIIRYREEKGRFLNIEEIMNVSGIGIKTFEDIKEHIYVIDPVYETVTETETMIHEETTEIYSEEVTFSLEELVPIDINTADVDILTMLPHIDEEIAVNIIEFREKNNGFKNEYELLLIDSLSRSEVSDIMEYIEIK